MTDKKTGIYYVQNPKGVVVMSKGKEIARYQNVEEFVAAHQEGIRCLKTEEERLDKNIENEYKSIKDDH